MANGSRVDVVVSGLDELLNRLASYRLAIRRELDRETAVVTRRAADVVRRHTPVRTGRTRRSIKGDVEFTPHGAHGTVEVEGAAAEWMPRLERRYGMLAKGRAYVRKNTPAAVRRALNRAARQTFKD